jgi:hypothetical protein
MSCRISQTVGLLDRTCMPVCLYAFMTVCLYDCMTVFMSLLNFSMCLSFYMRYVGVISIAVCRRPDITGHWELWLTAE